MTVRMRHTKGHRNNRRSHHALENPAISKEETTKLPHLRHRMNPVTGTYRGRQVVDVDAKLAKKAAKRAAQTEAPEATEA